MGIIIDFNGAFEAHARGEWGSESLQEACFLVLSFLLGAYTCGILIDKNQVHFMGKAFYGVALLLNSTLLVLAAFVPGRLLPACFVSAACGLQNAMCTSHFGAIIRTTHVTGTMTDIGSTLGRISMIYLRKGCRRSRLDDVERAEVGVWVVPSHFRLKFSKPQIGKDETTSIPGHPKVPCFLEVFCYIKPLPKSSRHLWVSWYKSFTF